MRWFSNLHGSMFFWFFVPLSLGANFGCKTAHELSSIAKQDASLNFENVFYLKRHLILENPNESVQPLTEEELSILSQLVDSEKEREMVMSPDCWAKVRVGSLSPTSTFSRYLPRAALELEFIATCFEAVDALIQSWVSKDVLVYPSDPASKRPSANHLVHINDRLINPKLEKIAATGTLYKKDYNPVDHGNDLPPCTVFYVGNGFAVSAGHCLQEQECAELDIYWQMTRGVAEPGHVSRCEPGFFKRLLKWYEHDYAIFKVTNPPKVSWSMASHFEDVKIGDTVEVWGHPRGRPLEIAGPCQITEINNEESFFRFDSTSCPTQGGNSGGPVVHLKTGQVIGILFTSGFAHRLDRIAGEFSK